MKKTHFVIACSLIIAYLIISGYSEGPAYYADLDRTGAEQDTGFVIGKVRNGQGCGQPEAGCHSTRATSGISVKIELDSEGIPTTHYVGGGSYTVKLTATNTTSNTLPRFGFQVGSIQGTKSIFSPLNAGSWQAPYPLHTHYAAPVNGNYSVGLMEHSERLLPYSGTGSQGSVYQVILNWKAPPAGTDTISFWAAMNIVNWDSLADFGDLWNTNQLIVAERSGSGTEGVDEGKPDSGSFAVFPNPARQNFRISLLLQEKGHVSIQLCDITGRVISNYYAGTLEAGNINMPLQLPASCASGLYYLVTVVNDTPFLKKIIVSR